MVRTAWMLTVAVVVLSVALLTPCGAVADVVLVAPPVVSYYAPAPTVSYYSAPVVAAPTVTYYRAPLVAAPAPTVTYSYGAWPAYYAPSYAVAPATIATTRYGLLGRPRVTTYYSPVWIGR